MVPFLLVAAVGYAAVCLVLYLSRDRLVFPIRGGGIAPPGDGRLIEIPVPGAIVRGWHLPGPADGPALLWFHGNGETVLGLGELLRAFKGDSFALIAVDYRGYGGSSGSPTPSNAEGDAMYVYDWVAARYPRVVVYGRSVGGGPAVWIASRRRVAGLILESPFTSLGAMARRNFPIFPSALAGRRFDNLSRLHEVHAPILIIHGAEDRLIPARMGRELYERASKRGGTADLWIIPGAEHNTTYAVGGLEYVRRVRAFVAQPGPRP